MNEIISDERLVIFIMLLFAVTFFTRAFPFIIFGGNNKTPPTLVLYLGKYLPPSLICVIIVYCLRNISFASFPFGAPEIIGASSVILLHLWKRNTILSIFGGTGIYMSIIQLIL